jgi:hypothetical protein
MPPKSHLPACIQVSLGARRVPAWRLRHRHITAACGLLTILMTCRPDQQMLQAMQQHIASTLHQYNHQSMATTIWALAKLSSKGSTDPAAAAGTTSTTSSTAPGSGSTSSTASSELVAALVESCQRQLHLWSPRDLSQAAWGLARLGAKPSQQWCQVGGSSVTGCSAALCDVCWPMHMSTGHCHLAPLVGGERQIGRLASN